MSFFLEESFTLVSKNTVSSYPFFEEMLNFIKWLWEQPVNNVFGYEMIFPEPTNERKIF